MFKKVVLEINESVQRFLAVDYLALAVYTLNTLPAEYSRFFVNKDVSFIWCLAAELFKAIFDPNFQISACLRVVLDLGFY